MLATAPVNPASRFELWITPSYGSLYRYEIRLIVGDFTLENKAIYSSYSSAVEARKQFERHVEQFTEFGRARGI